MQHTMDTHQLYTAATDPSAPKCSTIFIGFMFAQKVCECVHCGCVTL